MRRAGYCAPPHSHRTHPAAGPSRPPSRASPAAESTDVESYLQCRASPRHAKSPAEQVPAGDFAMIGEGLTQAAGPGAVGELDRVEAAVTVGVPDLVVRQVEARR